MVSINRLGHRIFHSLSHESVEGVKVVLGLAAIFWAVDPPNPQTPIMGIYLTPMWELLPYTIWQILFLAQGMALILDVFLEIQNKIVRCIDSVLGAFLWTITALSCILTNVKYLGTHWSPLVSIPAMLAIVSWISLFAHSKDDDNGFGGN